MKDMKDFELISVTNFGLGSKVIKIARECGVSGGTIFLGIGTVRSRLLEILSLDHVRREIALMVADCSLVPGVWKGLMINFILINHTMVSPSLFQ